PPSPLNFNFTFLGRLSAHYDQAPGEITHVFPCAPRACAALEVVLRICERSGRTIAPCPRGSTESPAGAVEQSCGDGPGRAHGPVAPPGARASRSLCAWQIRRRDIERRAPA